MKEWNGFVKDVWQREINVENFINLNYEEYLGDESFLSPISKKTNRVNKRLEKLFHLEQKREVLDIEVNKISSISGFDPGYIKKSSEVIVGLQTDKPLKRIINPYGGIRMVEQELKAYNYQMNEEVLNNFIKHRKTHNEGVFDAYDNEIKNARKVGLITGLPDSYGRGRIIGDYRRVALYGIDFLINKKQEYINKNIENITDEIITLREEVNTQIRALEEMKVMALSYGIDISKPASNAKEAVQWLYFAYLAGVKENNGAAMSMGRIDTFLDIFINKDLKENILNEHTAQELIDQFVLKLRAVRHLRTPEYDELFSGDPTWVTLAIGGMLNKEKSLVTKTSYRFIHTLDNLKPSPEPNITVLWSENLPINYKLYSAKMSIKTSSLQYQNDDLMCTMFGTDYGVSCCVSGMTIGKNMQYFGARCNIAKALLYAINEGKDEITNQVIIEGIPPLKNNPLNYEEVLQNYFLVIEKMAKIYEKAMHIIHFMHDKYAYEASLMALHDEKIHRFMAYGIAGLSVAADSLSAIKFAKVTPVRNDDDIAYDFNVEGEFPTFGNDDDLVDDLAILITEKVSDELKKRKLYRNAEATLSILTITSNVVYGEKTGSTPDGRKKGEAFAPGASPMHNRDTQGAIASLNSVSKLDYVNACKDGISNTFSITPDSLGDESQQANNLVSLLNGYFKKGAHHLNVNVLNKKMLIEAMEDPLKYPLLTIRVSGYAVRFNRLTKQQQLEVINRTFHDKI